MILSSHAVTALYAIERRPEPSQRFNPGVKRKLVSEGFATHIMLPSPYIRSRGSKIGHLQITDMGRVILEKIKSASETKKPAAAI